MMVIGYELEREHNVEVMVASDRMREDQTLGNITAWCPTCHVEHPVTRVQLSVR